MVKALTLIGCICIPAMMSLQAELTSRVYSVCELLASLKEFDGKTVKVRGVLEVSLEGSWLRSADCPSRFYAAGYSLPKFIALTYQSDFGRAAQRNREHIQQIDQQIKQAVQNPESDTVIVTYTGIFETRKDWVVLTYASGEKRLWGLGHDNGFPAQLVVTDVSEPVILHKGVKTKAPAQH